MDMSLPDSIYRSVPCSIRTTPYNEGAQLDTLMRSCGLSAEWVGQHAPKQAVQAKTVKHWVSGRSWPPQDVIDLVNEVDTRLSAGALAMAEQALVSNSADLSRPPVVLFRYRNEDDQARMWREWPDLKALPVSAFVAMVDRARLEIARQGHPVVIQYIAPE